MKKVDAKLFASLGMLAIIAMVPVSSVFAQTNTNENIDSFNEDGGEKKNLEKDSQNQKKEELRQIKAELKELKEQRTNFKEIRDNVRQIRDIASDVVVKPLPFDEVIEIPDREPDLVFRGETSGWTILGGKAHESAISIGGFAYKSDENKAWKIVADGKLSVADRNVKLEMKGYARSNHVVLHGTGHLEGGDSVRVVLKGNFAPTSEDGIYAIVFTHAFIHTDNSSERLKMMQVGSVTVESTDSMP